MTYTTFRTVGIGVALVVALFALGAVRVAAAEEMSSADMKCRQVLALGVRRLGATVLAEMQKCQQTRMLGELHRSTYDAAQRGRSPLRVDCYNLARLPAPSIDKINKAEAKLIFLAQKMCVPPVSPPATLGYTLCPAPCDGIAISDYDSVANCLACRVKSDCVAMNRDVLTCQGAVGAAFRLYTSTRAKEQQRCQARKDMGMLPTTDCMTADPQGRIARKLTKVQEAIKACLKACGDEMSDSMFVDVYEPQ